MAASTDRSTDSAPAPATRRWRFGEVTLDEARLELRVGGEPVHLHRKPLSVLLHLLQHAGEVVTKDELIEACWAGRLPSETVLTTTVNRLRKALGDGDQNLVKTVHGYGYRLAATVSVEWISEPLPARLQLQAGDHPPLRPGWLLEVQLGAGSSGEVWRIRNVKTGELRVCKFAVDGTALRALKREITLFRLLHDSLGDRDDLLHILDWNLEQAPFFVETEYLQHGSLLQWSDAQAGGLAALPLAQRLELIAQCAATLADAHDVGVLHKDLKPSNVLVAVDAGGTPRIKLADFGSGGLLDASGLRARGITRLGFTATLAAHEVTSGTPLYLPPEMLAGQPATVQADVYALGVMLYQAVAGDWSKPLAPGWERDVADELLREDIAAAVDGDPARRLADPAELARRLRHLDARRELRNRERAALAERRALQRRLQRTELGRRWFAISAAVLVLGLVSTLALYFALLSTQRERETALAQAQREAAVSEQVSEYLVSLFDAASPDESQGKPIEPRQLVDRGQAELAERFKDQPLIRARMLGTLGRVYCRLGLTAECERNMAQAVALQRAEGSDPLALAQLLYDRADAAGADARYDDAERDMREALQLLQGVQPQLPQDHPQIIAAKTTLGFLLRQQQKPAESIALLEEVRATLRDSHGEDGPASLELMGSLAISYQEAGRSAEALALSQQTTALARRHYGENDIEYLHALDHCGYLMFVAGRYEEAEQMRRELVAGYLHMYPADSYPVLNAQYNHAVALRRRGKLREAVALMQQVVEGERRVAEADDPDLALSLAALGGMHAELGDTAAALPLVRQAERITREHYADGSLLTHSRRLDLGELMNAMGRTREALALLEAPIPDTWNSATAAKERARRLRLLADAQRAAGEHERAQSQYREAAAAYAALLPAGDGVFGQIAYGNARSLIEQGRDADALPLLQQLATDLQRQLVPDAPRLLEANITLADVLRRLGQGDAARKLISQVRADAERGLHPAHPARIVLSQWRDA